jgi:dTDP-glucose 4,6-dehydratase
VKLFVTGGAGFIGSNFIRYVLERRSEDRIVNYDKLTYAGNLANLSSVKDSPRYSFVCGDICNALAVEEVMKGCDAVVHFAAESHVDRSISGPAPFIESNVAGTLNLLEVARKLRPERFVHVSTDEVYGEIPAGEFADEGSSLRPSNPYAASKAGADLLVSSYVRTYGIPAIITRSVNCYGLFQFPEKFVPLIITNAFKDKPLPIYGDGRQQRQWLHVEDNCRGVFAALEKGRVGEIYNIGSPEIEENLSLARRLLLLLGKPESLLSHVKDRPGHDRRYALRCEKIEKELSWKPQIPLEEGLRKTVDWYKANTEWVESVCNGEYRSYYIKQYGKSSEALQV